MASRLLSTSMYLLYPSRHTRYVIFEIASRRCINEKSCWDVNSASSTWHNFVVCRQQMKLKNTLSYPVLRMPQYGVYDAYS